MRRRRNSSTTRGPRVRINMRSTRPLGALQRRARMALRQHSIKTVGSKMMADPPPLPVGVWASIKARMPPNRRSRSSYPSTPAIGMPTQVPAQLALLPHLGEPNHKQMTAYLFSVITIGGIFNFEKA